jgi:hypothetical protein
MESLPSAQGTDNDLRPRRRRHDAPEVDATPQVKQRRVLPSPEPPQKGVPAAEESSLINSSVSASTTLIWPGQRSCGFIDAVLDHLEIFDGAPIAEADYKAYEEGLPGTVDFLVRGKHHSVLLADSAGALIGISFKNYLEELTATQRRELCAARLSLDTRASAR